ncbi:MAG: CHAT domain-containing protein, partial [Spirulina sp.]
INGLLQVTGGNSHLFLMNPAGIVFGSEASLNVPGDFTATTATRIGLGDEWCSGVGENDYQGLIGDPTRFAFDLARSGAILNAGDLRVTGGANISLLGGSVLNLGTIEAQGGNITLAAIPGTNWVRISKEGTLLSLEIPLDALETGITAQDLPELLAPKAKNIAQMTPTDLHSSGLPLNAGDVSIAGKVTGETVHLAAANRVRVAPSTMSWVSTGDETYSAPTVTLFPEDVGTSLNYVFIDANIGDYQSLLYGGEVGTVSVVVTPEEDGISAIAERLAAIAEEGQKFDDLHIVTEGNAGNFWLGKDFVAVENIDRYRQPLQAWGESLSETADILLYSCWTALGAVGEGFINAVAAETGADVAASVDVTGSTHYNGNWTLESQTGSIEAGMPFSEGVTESWHGKLATLTVTNLFDSGGGSLRDRIDAASAGDTIAFSVTGTINLGSEIAWGTENLTINGSGQTALFIDGGGSDRIFNISAGNATIQNLTIRNGSTAGNGGGIYHSGFGSLTVNSNTVSGNSSNGAGGGIAALNDVNLTNSTVSGNSSISFGGGIYARNDVNLTNGTVSGNSSNANGGGIFVSNEVNLTNSTVSGNSSVNQGGGIFANNDVNLTNSTVSRNSSTNRGGGIYASNEVNLTNSTVSGNSSGLRGGGIYVANDVNLTNSTVSGNSSNSDGGGIFAQGLGTIRNSTIAYNTTETNGGGIYKFGGGTFNIANTIIAKNVALGTGNDLAGDFTGSTFNSNLIGDTSGATNLTLGTSNMIADPLLSPLGNYGGDTQNHILLPGSPAINAGDSATATATDQRGNHRGISSGLPDIGAVEITADLGVTQTNPPIFLAGTATDLILTLLNNGPDPVGSIALEAFIETTGVSVMNVIPSLGTYDRDTHRWDAGILSSSLLSVDGSPTFADLLFRIFADFGVTEIPTLQIANLTLAGEDPSPINNQISPPADPSPVLFFAPHALTHLQALDFFGVRTALSAEPLPELTIDDLFSSDFENYFGISPVKRLSLKEIQQRLRDFEAATGVRTASIYAIFAASTLTPIPETSMGVKVKPENTGLFWSYQPTARDRLELLLILPEGNPIRQSTTATRAEVLKVVQEFRQTVTNPRRPTAYLAPAQQLYDWLLAPLEPELQNTNIQNLVYILDRGLRTLPLAALHDGQSFVIDRYSLGLAPSLALTDLRPPAIADQKILAMGAERFTDKEPLPAVSVELAAITDNHWQGTTYLNEEFTRANLTRARGNIPYGIVHLATHSDFRPGKPSESYIQLWDEKLSLDELKGLGWDSPTVELLVLSACRTALNSPEAELGFAGLTVASGVKSAIGSLWYVSDIATLGLMLTFYEQLEESSLKAESLRQAQLSLMRGQTSFEGGELAIGADRFPLPPDLAQMGDRTFTHPYYWSGFALIGNPW